MQPYTIIFLGTPDFAVPTLETLVSDERFSVAAVVTAPDKPVGRKQVLTPPPVKTAAERLGVSVLQPENIMDAYDDLAKLKPDCMIVIAYGHILPQTLIDLPPYGIVNLHASLLPRWRGASPIQSAIAAGDAHTGVTLMKIDAGCDTGDLLASESIAIAPVDTGKSLHDKLAALSANVTKKYLADYCNGAITPQPQDDARATMAGKLTRNHGRIDWNKPAAVIERVVRAYFPWPGTWTVWNGKTLKIIAVAPEPITINDYSPGTVFEHEGALAVQCGENALELETVQLEGKKRVGAKEFALGNGDITKSTLK